MGIRWAGRGGGWLLELHVIAWVSGGRGGGVAVGTPCYCMGSRWAGRGGGCWNSMGIPWDGA